MSGTPGLLSRIVGVGRLSLFKLHSSSRTLISPAFTTTSGESSILQTQIRKMSTEPEKETPPMIGTERKPDRVDIRLEVKSYELPKSLQILKNLSSIQPKTTGEADKLYKKIELEILGYESRVLDSYQWFVLATAKHLNLTVGKVWSPHKSDKFRFNLLASVHIFKKHQVHYEVRTYHRFINFHKLTGSTADTFLEYIERNLPEGVAMKVTRVEVIPKPEFLDAKVESDQPAPV